MQIHVGIHAQTAFLHVAVGDLQVRQQQFEFFKIGLGLCRAAQIRLADDFQQGYAGAIEVNLRVADSGGFVMHAFSGVFF